MEYINGYYFKYTLLNNEFHSYDDLPAIIYADGIQYWYKKGKLHRDNDLPAVICVNGYAEWWTNGDMVKEYYNYQSRTKSARN